MNKLIYFKLLMVLLACLVAVQVSAYDFVKDGIYYNVSGSNATVTYKDTNYNSYSGTVNIPATVTNGGTTYNVRTIGISAFQNCSNLKRVVIPNSVQYMSNYAFSNCTGLTNITIPATVFTIYNNVFEGCTALASVICLNTTPPSWFTNNFSSSTYSNATLIVPQGCKSAYQSSTNCWGSFQKIEEMDCDFVEDAIFYNNLGNNQVEVTHALRFAEDYSGDITIPQTVTHGGTTYTVTSIGYEAFFNSYNLYTLSIPATVNNIENYAFYSCHYLTSVNIPEGVQNINYCTFGECTRLPSIIIPASVTWIAQNAFSGCMSLTSITCRAITPPMCSDSSSFPTTAYSNATLYVPSNALSDYQAADVWQRFSNITAKDYDFEYNGIYYRITSSSTVAVTFKDRNYNSYSGSVNIPQTVTHDGTTYTVTAIGRGAFWQSTGLTAVSIPNTVTLIDYAAFYSCTALTSVTIPNSVTELGQYCFQGCTALQQVVIGSSVTNIPMQCFLYCESLSQVTIPASVKEIGTYAFGYCTRLTTATMQNGVESIGYSAFIGCSSLQTITIPASVTAIGESVLSECSALVAINVNNANTHYRSQDGVLFTAAMDSLLAFPNMSCTDYQVPASVTVIGASAFNGCDNLKSIILPEGLTTISSGAFQSCLKLTTLHIPASVSHIEGGALANCVSMTSINVAEGSQSYMTDYGVLYTIDGKIIIQYPCGRPDKHYSILNTCDSLDYLSFLGTINLKSVYVPCGIKSIEQNTFRESNLERVVIDEGMESIKMNAFAGCYALKSVYLPSTLTQIENYAFQVCTAMQDITFAGEVPPTLGENALYGVGYDNDNPTTLYVPAGASSAYNNNSWNSSYFTYNVSEISPLATGTTFTVDSLNYATTDDLLNTKVSGVVAKTLTDLGIPPKVAYQGNLCTVTTLGYTSLQNCTKMVRAEVPFTVTWMDDYSFYGCTDLQTVILRNGLTQIDPFSLSHIDKMTTLTIPASVDSVASTFVNYSNGLEKILVARGNAKYTSSSGVLFTKDRKQLVAYPHAHSTNYTVPTGTQVIRGSSFRGAAALQQVNLPKTLRTIESSAFFDNTALTSISVPEGVTTIGVSAFSGCTAMASAELPSTLTTLGYLAFRNTPLTSLTVKATTPPTCQTRIDPRTHEIYLVFDESHFSGCTLYVPRGTLAAYQAAATWKEFLNIVEVDMPVEDKRGDVNGDGSVSIADVTSLIDYLLSGNASYISTVNADVNQDGSISIADVTALIDYLLSGHWPIDGIDMWYLMGDNVGCCPWENTGNSSIGRGLLPLFPVGNFDNNGQGELTCTDYFGRSDAVMLIHNPGSYDDCWGYKPNGIFGRGGEEITGIATGNDGYYTILLNTKDNRFYFWPYTASTPLSFTTINVVGNHSEWDVTNSTYNMTNMSPYKENHNWILRDFTVAADGELKFAADNDWTYNWGAATFPFGRGERDGYNVPIEAGTYDVYFNDITGDFNFIKK